MCIRTATLEDAPAIASLSSQLGYPADPDEVAAFQARVFQHPDHLVLVSEDQDGVVCAWLHAFVSRRLFVPPFAELGGIVVDEARRRAGIGRALMARAEEWAAQSGCSVFRIRSNTSRAGAHEFYQSAGYATSKTQQVFEKRMAHLRHA